MRREAGASRQRNIAFAAAANKAKSRSIPDQPQARMMTGRLNDILSIIERRSNLGITGPRAFGGDPMADNVVRVCAQSDIAPETVKAYDVSDHRLAVFNIDGKFYITDDECTHASASLAEGMLEGDVIECCLHFAAFHVPTGAVKAPPASLALRTYKVVLNGDDVFVDLDKNAAGEPA
jgi:ethylbenzene dioxygenase ferredoxin component